MFPLEKEKDIHIHLHRACLGAYGAPRRFRSAICTPTLHQTLLLRTVFLFLGRSGQRPGQLSPRHFFIITLVNMENKIPNTWLK